MARIRTIKPEFFTSADILALTPLARLFYVALWCEADREGLLNWSPRTLKFRYLPGDDVEVESLGNELSEAGLIIISECDDGKVIALIPGFKTHQVINNRESESVLISRVKGASPRVQAEGKEGREGKGKERKGTEGKGGEDAQGVVVGAVTAVDLSIAFRASGVQSQPANPVLIELASQGVTPETVKAACEAAKEAKPGEVIALNYVAAILKRWAADAAKLDVEGAAKPQARSNGRISVHDIGKNAPQFKDPFARKA